MNIAMRYAIKASYGNDSIALIQWMADEGLTDAWVIHNDTGWAHPDWKNRVEAGEKFARSLGMRPVTLRSLIDTTGECIGVGKTELDSEEHVMLLREAGTNPWLVPKISNAARPEGQNSGFVPLVRLRKGFPRHGMQFCTTELKIRPTMLWLAKEDPDGELIGVVGVRREESSRRATWPEWTEDSELDGGRSLWAPLARMLTADRDKLVQRAGFDVLAHRSDECFPCVNSARADLRRVAEVPERIAEIAALESELSDGKDAPRRMFRRQGSIQQTIAWAQSSPGTYVEAQQFLFGCDAGFCGV